MERHWQRLPHPHLRHGPGAGPRGIQHGNVTLHEPTLFTVMSRGELTDRKSAAKRPDDEAFAQALSTLLDDNAPEQPLHPSNPVLAQLAARCMMHGLAHFFADGMLATIDVGSEHAARLADALTHSLRPESLPR